MEDVGLPSLGGRGLYVDKDKRSRQVENFSVDGGKGLFLDEGLLVGESFSVKRERLCGHRMHFLNNREIPVFMFQFQSAELVGGRRGILRSELNSGVPQGNTDTRTFCQN